MSTETPSNKAQPLYIAAAIAVIVFAVIGSASMLGWLPGSKKDAPPTAAMAPATAPAPPPQAAAPPPPATPAPAMAPVAQAPVAAPAPVARKHKAKTASPPAQTAAKVCGNCGTISAIRAIEQPGEATGLGAVAGGVAGALVGSQIGQGRGTTAAEIVGAAGGAYAGHQIEKNYRKTMRYEIDVRMEDGTRRVFSQTAEPALSVGERVRIINGQLEVY